MSHWDLPRRTSTLGGAIYLAVVGLVVAGLVIVALGPWRSGLQLMGAGLLVGALSRLVLPTSRAGMLRVRTRLEDVVLMAGIGVALIVLTVWIPDRPTL